MPDRDKVVKALEICTTRETCRYCPYNGETCCYEILERDALELLKALPEPPKEDFIAIAKKDNGWISVNDKEPNPTHNGILYCDAHGNVGVTYSIITFRNIYFDDSFREEAGIKSEYELLIPENRITHWMPLPEPPKEVQKDA